MLSPQRKRLVLLAAIMGSFVAGLDATVVNVALPAISRDLGGGLAGQQWVSNAYLLALGAFILIGGSLGDVFGERRVFSLGVAGFGAASLLCAVAPTIERWATDSRRRSSTRGRRSGRSSSGSVSTGTAGMSTFEVAWCSRCSARMVR